MVSAAGPAAGMTVPQMAMVAVAAIGLFVAVMLLVLGMSRRGTRPTAGHRLRPRTWHNRPGLRPSAAPARPRPPAARTAPRLPAAQAAPRLPAARTAPRLPAARTALRPSDHASQDLAARTESYSYGPPSLWHDVPDDPPGWR
jgi:hypothetical protein